MVIQQHLYTVDDVWNIAHQLENENNHYDLIDGELFDLPPPGGVHGRLASKISRYLGIFADEHDLGEVTVEPGIIPLIIVIHYYRLMLPFLAKQTYQTLSPISIFPSCLILRLKLCAK